MESKTTTAFAAIKQDVRMNEWMSQIQAQKASTESKRYDDTTMV